MLLREASRLTFFLLSSEFKEVEHAEGQSQTASSCFTRKSPDNEIIFKVSFLQQKLALSLGADYINCLPVKQADKYERLSDCFVLVLPSAEILKIYRRTYQITRDIKSRVN